MKAGLHPPSIAVFGKRNTEVQSKELPFREVILKLCVMHLFMFHESYDFKRGFYLSLKLSSSRVQEIVSLCLVLMSLIVLEITFSDKEKYVILVDPMIAR